MNMISQLPQPARRTTPKPKRISDYSRARDEQILDWVARRAAGESCYNIAATEGVSRGQVVAATNRVMMADFTQCREPIYVGEYWK